MTTGPLRNDHLDASLPVHERVESLLAQMTVEEKAGQMMQLDARGDIEDAVLRLRAGSLLHASPDHVRRAQHLVRRTRLRIPLLIADDCIHGHSFYEGATIFPTQLGMASTWDPALLERVARATAEEVAATGVHWTFSPVLCIARDLRWGRVGETFGEDPHLIGALGAAMVRGYQGDGLGDPTAILATAKHFAGYSETQGGRDASEADISRRKLRSWFLPPFQRVAQEGCRTFMLGYQTMDGVPTTVNEWLLHDVLREEWGYRGTLVTDWDNVGRMVWEQRVQPDYVAASAAAVRAGNDLIMATPGFFDGVLDAIGRGLLSEEELDDAVRHILTLKFELGLFEDPRTPDDGRIATTVGADRHRDLNREVARRSLVLLRNDGVLPLHPERPLRVAVVGALADDAQTQLGDWAGSSGQVDWMPDGHPRALITTVLDGFRLLSPPGSTVTYAHGGDILEFVPDPLGPVQPDGQPRPPIALSRRPDAGVIAEATRAAAGADVVVAVVGDLIDLAGECRSTATLDLLGGQRELLEAVVSTGTPVIVVLLASKPLALPPVVDQAAGLVWAASPGMEGGRAIAELAFGLVEPRGRLPISFPRHVGQQPTYYNQVRGQHGHRYADLTQDPAFAFGEGLTYGDVRYEEVWVEQTDLSPRDTVRIRARLRNVGARDATEVVQAYVRDTVTSASWADRELKAFTHVAIPAGTAVEVGLEVPVAECTIVDRHGRRVVEPGDFEVLVGPSSRLEHLTGVRFRVTWDAAGDSLQPEQPPA